MAALDGDPQAGHPQPYLFDQASPAKLLPAGFLNHFAPAWVLDQISPARLQLQSNRQISDEFQTNLHRWLAGGWR